MESFEFTLKLLSPAFIAGAMEKKSGRMYLRKNKPPVEPMERVIGPDSDGLRPPSLKGILRFWFRAKEGERPIKELKEIEDWLFGNTDSGQGIRLIFKEQVPKNWQPKVIGGNGQIPAGSALAYLGYGPLNYVSRQVGVSSFNSSMHRYAIPENTRFVFKVLGNSQQIKELKKTLLLLHLFGGVGSRSRRAWGSVAVEADFIFQIQPGETFQQWFDKCFANIWDEKERPSQKTSLPSFSAFSKNIKIKISNHSFPTYEEVMKEFGKQFSDTRQWNYRGRSFSPPIAIADHDLEEKDAIAGTLTGLPKRLAFGMPYHPQSFRNHWDIEYKGYYPDPKTPGKMKTVERRASPLFLKVFQGPDGKLRALSLLLKSRFFGFPSAKVGTSNSPGKTLPVTDWSAIDAFLNNTNWQTINIY